MGAQARKTVCALTSANCAIASARALSGVGGPYLELFSRRLAWRRDLASASGFAGHRRARGTIETAWAGRSASHSVPVVVLNPNAAASIPT